MGYLYGFASVEDGEEISKLIEDVDFEGEISLAYARRPNAVISLAKECDVSVFVVARDDKDNKIVGVGACAIKNKIAYLTGLRARRRVNIPKCYALLGDFCKANDVKLTYTTILKSNTGVQKMLEKERASMPNYVRFGECIVHIIRKHLRIKDKNNLIKAGNNYILENHQGEIIASCKAIEQWGFKQCIVKHYGWKIKVLKTFIGWIPKEGEVLKFFTLADVKANDGIALESLLRHASNMDFAGNFFLYGGISSICPVKSLKYKSVVYIVDWEKKMQNAEGIELKLEMADL